MNKQRKKSKLNELFNFSPIQVYNDIKTKCEQNGELFEDDFVAGPEVLTNDYHNKLYRQETCEKS